MEMKAIYKSLAWYFWNLALGMAPLFIIGYFSFFVQDNKLAETIRHEIVHSIRGYIIMFYSIALLGNVSFDLLLCNHRYKSHLYFIMGVFPFALLCFAIIHYLASFFGNTPDIRISKLIFYQIIIFAFASICSISIKAYLIKNENKLL
jgi:hypothetical protein